MIKPTISYCSIVEAAGGKCLPVQVDVRDEAQVSPSINQSIDRSVDQVLDQSINQSTEPLYNALPCCFHLDNSRYKKLWRMLFVLSGELILWAIFLRKKTFGQQFCWRILFQLVNNASAISLTGTQDTPMKKYDLMNQVNARGTYLT